MHGCHWAQPIKLVCRYLVARHKISCVCTNPISFPPLCLAVAETGITTPHPVWQLRLEWCGNFHPYLVVSFTISLTCCQTAWAWFGNSTSPLIPTDLLLIPQGGPLLWSAALHRCVDAAPAHPSEQLSPGPQRPGLPSDDPLPQARPVGLDEGAHGAGACWLVRAPDRIGCFF